MTFEQIKYFLILSQTLNFTKTAEMLYLTQPTISRQIKQLEEELGVPLFYRIGNNIYLTPSGEELYNYFSDASALIQEGIKKSKDVLNNKKGILRVGCLISMKMDRLLADCYKIFNQLYPDVQFVFEKNQYVALIEKLNARELDLVFTLESRTSPIYGVEKETIFSAAGVCLYSGNHPMATKKDLAISDFSGSTIVCLVDEASPRGKSGIMKISTMCGIENPTIVQLPNLESVFFYVHAGIGIALLDRYVPNIIDPNLFFFDLPCKLAYVKGIALYRSDCDNPAIRHFMQIVLNESIDSYLLPT